MVRAGDSRLHTRTLVNATGTWTRPFVPHYPGIEAFGGEQLHTAAYPGAEHFRGRRVLVVGGGASAVQHLGELAPVTDTVWVTRRPPVWRETTSTRTTCAPPSAWWPSEYGGAAPGERRERDRTAAAPPGAACRRLGAYPRAPDVLLDRAGRRALGRRLVRAGRRDPLGDRVPPRHRAPGAPGAALVVRRDPARPAIGRTTTVADPRVHLVGYGPSASTIGANRAGRAAARGGQPAAGRRRRLTAASRTCDRGVLHVGDLTTTLPPALG